jgi:predicted Zn-dependent protease
LIEKGEITKQVKYALLVGNLYESIQKEVMFASDHQVNSKRFMPTMAFAGLEIVGQQ